MIKPIAACNFIEKKMIRNYVLSAWRSLLKNRTATVINLFGLVMGFGCFLVINLYVYREFHFDSHHKNASRIYRLTHNETAGELPGTRHLATVGPPVGPALKETFPQVEDAVRFRHAPNRTVRYNDQQHYENDVYFVDPSIFKVFTFPLLKGDVTHALALPNNVVITEDIAKKYFGEDDPMGKNITINGSEWLVSGVLAPLPQHIHLKFDILLPFEAFRVPFGYPVTLQDWGWISFHTYILLREGEDAQTLENQLPEFVRTHWSEDRAKRFRFELQSLEDIYLGEPQHEQVASGNTTYLYVLSGAALLILFIAGFNFANLFAATSTTRAKEIGVRKVIGARKPALALQMMMQSVGLAMGAAGLSVLLLLMVEPLVPLSFSASLSTNEMVLATGALLLLALLIGLLAGLQPALLLSGLDQQKLLKGVFKTGSTGLIIRRTLVVAQFAISISLIAAVLIIQSQMQFLAGKDLGYAKDELLLLRMPGEQLMQRFPELKQQLLQNPQVSMVSIGGGRMDGDNGNVPIYTESTEETGRPMNIDAITFDFFKTIGINLLAGREFNESRSADTLRGVIINQAAAKELGWSPEEAIGKKIRIGNIVLDGEVIGVTPDFHFGSLHKSIAPLVMSYPRTRLEDVYVRFSSNNLSTLIADIQKSWNIIAPDLPFDYVILNQHLQGLYRAEQSFLSLFRLFGMVAIIIASLGLYGLISQDLVFRVKEIGIRKVLGASVSSITFLLLKQFVVLVLVANLVAWPFCWYFMKTWLNEFSYHISINWLVFPGAGLVTVAIALLTISQKSIQSARANPVKSLRSE